MNLYTISFSISENIQSYFNIFQPSSDSFTENFTDKLSGAARIWTEIARLFAL